MFVDKVPLHELQQRHLICRNLLKNLVPQADGMLVSSRLNIYYLSGTMADGFFWLPLEGEPILLTHRGIERAKLESVIQKIIPYHSYKELDGLCAEAGSPLAASLGVDQEKLSWSMGLRLEKSLSGKKFFACDNVLRQARSVKSEWELTKLRFTGERHRRASEAILPSRLKIGMTELAIARLVITIFGEQGNGTVIRMNAHDEENYGMVAVGESGLYPTYFNGCLGWLGQDPGSSFLGNSGVIWTDNKVLTIDFGFEIAAYNTDKTQIYWSGSMASVPEKLMTAHKVCEEIYQRCIAELKPGSIPSEIWFQAEQIARKNHQSEGFMGLAEGNKTRFLGHGVGLTVDDLPVFAKGFDDPLKVGMVVALEPKIAIPGIGMVGVENTFEITQNGACSLTGNLIDIVPIM